MKGQNWKHEVQFWVLVLLFNEESIALPTDLDFLPIFDRFEEIRFPGSCFFSGSIVRFSYALHETGIAYL